MLERWRGITRASGGALIIETAPAEIKGAFDVWGLGEAAALLMPRLKQQFDVDGLLSPGHFAAL